MTSTLKKISLAITGLWMVMAIQVNGEDSQSSSCCPSCKTEPCCPSPKPTPPCTPPPPSCCPSMCCKQSPYCGPNCLPAPFCGEINVKAELLYWRPELCGLEAAFGDTTIATTVAGSPAITTTTVTESDKDPHSKWSFGFRVGADLAIRCFDLEADWTHFHGRATFSDDPQHGRWHIDYDTIDLTLGRRWCAAPCFYFKPFIGVRGLRLHHKLTSHLETLSTALTGNSTIFTDKDDKEKFWGIAPELGLEANWYLGCNFSLYGSFDFVYYYGEVTSHNFDTDTFTSTVSVSHGHRKHCFNNLGTDLALGIRWDKSWVCRCYGINLMLKLGAEQHRIYELSNLGSDGTLSLDGANVGVGIGFRY